jgi:hypothetical protein
MTRAALACALLLLAATARAQDAATAPPVSDEFVGLFSSYCLQKFPDDEALTTQASSDQREALTDAQVKTFLHSDPGQGWVLAGADGKYVLTTERPPFHACAVRRYSGQVLDGAPFVAAARSFAVARGHSLGPLQTRRTAIGPNIISSAMMLQEVDEKGIPTLETYMFFVVSYPAMAKADGTEGKPFYDIRFVRQIYRQPV